MQTVILAAGKGTRLHPVSETRSKAMAPVVGKPIVARVIDIFLKNGIRDIVLIVSPTDVAIRAHDFALPDDVQIQFVEQVERLGMAHALSLAAPLITGDFILSACDNLVPDAHIGALLETHRATHANGTLSLMPVPRERIARTGIVEMCDEQVLRIVEKPTPEEAPSNISSLPLYVFSPKILGYLPDLPRSPRGEYELQDGIQRLIDETGPLSAVFTEDRIQLTNVADLLALNRHYLATQNGADVRHPADLDPTVRVIEPVRIDDGAIIGANSTVGPNVYIEAGARIGSGSTVSDAIILAGISVADGETVAGAVLSPSA